jgi:hypothetical protein
MPAALDSNRYSLNLGRLDPEVFASKPRRASKPVRQTDRSESGEEVDRSATSTGMDAEPVRVTDGSEETEGPTGTREIPVRKNDRCVSRTRPVRLADLTGPSRVLNRSARRTLKVMKGQ